MGVKMGQQVFYRMVQHVLRNCMPESGPYIDDVLSSTGNPPPGQRGKGKLMDSHAYCNSDPPLHDSVEEWDPCFEHDHQICFRISKAVADAGLTVQPSKCFFFMRQVEYVRYILGNRKRLLWPTGSIRISRRQNHSRGSLARGIGSPFTFMCMLTMPRLSWRRCLVSIGKSQSPPTRKVLWTERANPCRGKN